MALLRRRELRARRIATLAACGLLPCIVSCDSTAETGNLELELFDRAVTCMDDGPCIDERGETVTPESLVGFAFLDTEPSRHDHGGLYVYYEIARPDGERATGELDVSLEGEEPIVGYRETVGDDVVFESAAARGVIVAPGPRDTNVCACPDGLFELVFTDAGEDGVIDTPDDLVRRLSRARFGWGDGRCLAARRFVDLPLDVEVRPPEGCTGVTRPREVPRAPSGPTGDDRWDDHYHGSTTVVVETDGSCNSGSSGGSCDGDGGSSSDGSCSDSGSSSGDCSGDSGGGCDGGDSCAGDTGGASGCAGDAGGGDCAGDAGGASCSDCSAGAPPPRIGRRRRRILGGGFQTLALVALALFLARPRRG